MPDSSLESLHRFRYTVIEHLRQESSSSSTQVPLAYFYCIRNAAEPQRADPIEILLSIVKQLSSAEADLPIRMPTVEAFKLKEKEAQKDGSNPSRLGMDECVKLIVALLETNPAVIVIDALDECDPIRRHELFQALDNIIQRSASIIQVFVSSRDDTDIFCRLARSSNVFIQAKDNGEDIARFIEVEVSNAISDKRLLYGSVSGELENEIKWKLEEGAQGM
jgi:hypothetical protein